MNYEFLEKIGEGTFGVTYKVKKIENGEIFVMKKIRYCGEVELEEYKNINNNSEYLMLNKLNHVNIIKFFECVFYNNRHFLVFEYMNYDLENYLKNVQCVPLNMIQSIMKQSFEALKYLKQNKIIHSDIKPANILINLNGEIKLCDFGSAHYINKIKYVYGSTNYLSPEYILLGNNDISEKNYLILDYGIDIWALGCVFFELLTQQIFFEGYDAEGVLISIFKKFGTKKFYLEYISLKEKNCWLPKKIKKKSIEEWKIIIPRFDFEILDLIKQIFTYSVKKRISARKALKHKYFLKNYEIKQPTQNIKVSESFIKDCYVFRE